MYLLILIQKEKKILDSDNEDLKNEVLSGEKEMVRLCMAVSAGAVITVGTKPPDSALIEQLMPEVRMQML